MSGRIKQKTFTQNLAVAGLTASFSTDDKVDFELVAITFKTAGAATETFTITYDNPDGATYDTVLSAATTLSNSQNAIYAPTNTFLFPGQSAISITSTNATATVLYVTVLYKEL